MKGRPALLALLLTSIGAAGTIVGCAAPSAMHSALPPTAQSNAQAPAGVDAEAALEQRVLAAHGEVAGGAAAAYGTVIGKWITPPKAAQPGYYIIDGETLPGPPEDVPAATSVPQTNLPQAPAPAATPLNCQLFVGDVPPPCTSTGEFRRVFSGPGYSFALAHLTLPANIPTMPKTLPLTDGDIGYAYMEGWSKANPDSGNSEFGFQYSAANNWYTPYVRTNNPAGFFIYVTAATKKPVHYRPFTPVTFAFAGYTIGTQNYLHVAVAGTTDVACAIAGSKTTTNLCLVHGHLLDNDWSPSQCCIMARMTTIGQTNPENAFYDGAKFGPIAWSGVELAQTAPTPAPGSTTLPLTNSAPPWTSAGEQNWPPAQQKVVAETAGDTAEVDTIDLAELPVPTFSLNPAKCQTGKAGTTLNYSLNPVALQGLPVGYLWGFNDPRGTTDTLSVPGDTIITAGGYFGPGTKAALHLMGSRISGVLTANLYFQDAAGAWKDHWTGDKTYSVASGVGVWCN